MDEEEDAFKKDLKIQRTVIQVRQEEEMKKIVQAGAGVPRNMMVQSWSWQNLIKRIVPNEVGLCIDAYKTRLQI